jgi:hypothetical protein
MATYCTICVRVTVFILLVVECLCYDECYTFSLFIEYFRTSFDILAIAYPTFCYSLIIQASQVCLTYSISLYLQFESFTFLLLSWRKLLLIFIYSDFRTSMTTPVQFGVLLQHLQVLLLFTKFHPVTHNFFVRQIPVHADSMYM